MARLRFPGRPGYRFDRLGIRYGADDAKNVTDPTLAIVANIHRGLRLFRELYGESDEDEEFLGFTNRDVKKSEKKLAAMVETECASPKETAPYSTPELHGTRLASAKESLESLPTSERTRGRFKTIVRKSYQEIIKQGLAKPLKKQFLARKLEISTPEDEKVSKKISQPTSTKKIKEQTDKFRKTEQTGPPFPATLLKKGMISVITAADLPRHFFTQSKSELREIKIKIGKQGEPHRLIRGKGRPSFLENQVKELIDTKSMSRKLKKIAAEKFMRIQLKQQEKMRREYEIARMNDEAWGRSKIKQTSSGIVKRIIQKAKTGKKILRRDSEDSTSTASSLSHQRREFVLPSQSSRSSRVIIPNKRLLQDDSIHQGVKKGRLSGEFSPTDGSHFTMMGMNDSPSLFHTSQSFSGLASQKHGLFDGPLVVEGKRARKPSLKVRLKLSQDRDSQKLEIRKLIEERKRTMSDVSFEGSYPGLSLSPTKLHIQTSFSDQSPSKTKMSSLSPLFSSPFASPKFGVSPFSQTSPPIALSSMLERQRLEELEREAEATRRSGYSILRKAKLRLNRKDLNLCKADLAHSLKVQMKREAKEEKMLKQQVKSRASTSVKSSSSGLKEKSATEIADGQTDGEAFTGKKKYRRRRCLVCGDPRILTSVPTCDDCRKFYRCYKRRAAKLEFICIARGHCVITKTDKTACVACRFRKCEDVFKAFKKPGVEEIRVEKPSKTQVVTIYRHSGKHHGKTSKMEEGTDQKDSETNTPDKHSVKSPIQATQTEPHGNVQSTVKIRVKMKSPGSAKSVSSKAGSATGDIRGPRIKHVCRKAAVVLGKNVAKFPAPSKLTLSALPQTEKTKLLKEEEEAKAAAGSDDERPLEEIIQQSSDNVINMKKVSPVKLMHKPHKKLPKILGKRKVRCRKCEGCLAPDCAKCVYCLDKTKFGGPNVCKQACIYRKCQFPTLARAATSAFIQPKEENTRGDMDKSIASTANQHSNGEESARTNKLACLALGASFRESRKELTQSGKDVPETDSQNNNIVDTKSESCVPVKAEVECKNGHGCEGMENVDCENNIYSAIHIPSSYLGDQYQQRLHKNVEKPVVQPGITGTDVVGKLDLLQPMKKVKNKDKVVTSMRSELSTLRPGFTVSNENSASLVHLIRADLRVSYDVEVSWQYGMALTMSGMLCLRTVCYLCGSAGKHDFIYCNICCEPFHEFCLEENQAPNSDNMDNWYCQRCQYCNVCGNQNNLLQCDKCQNTYHPECLGPNYPTKPSKTKKIWVCTKCVRCKSCGATTPGDGWNATWTHDFSLCYECGQLMDKGNFCPICHKCYSDDDWDSKMVQCASCESWVHAKCEGLTDEMYNRVSFLPDDIHYTCRICSQSRVSDWQTALQTEFLTGLHNILSSLINSKCAQHLIKFKEQTKPEKDVLNAISDINVGIKEIEESSKIKTEVKSVSILGIGDIEQSKTNDAVELCDDAPIHVVEPGNYSETNSIQTNIENTSENIEISRDQSERTIIVDDLESDSLIKETIDETTSVCDNKSKCDDIAEISATDCHQETLVETVKCDEQDSVCVVPQSDTSEPETKTTLCNEESHENNYSAKPLDVKAISEFPDSQVELDAVEQSNGKLSISASNHTDVPTEENVGGSINSMVLDSTKSTISILSPQNENEAEKNQVSHSNSNISEETVRKDGACDAANSNDIPSNPNSVTKQTETEETKTDLVLSPGHVHFMEGKKIQKITPSRPMPQDLEAVELKINSRRYQTVEEFSEDLVYIIQTALDSFDNKKMARKKANISVRSIFLKQMDKFFPWFNVKACQLWEKNRNLPEGMLDDAVLPPSDDHIYAQWLKQLDTPLSPQPSPFKRLLHTPIKKIVPCALNDTDSGRSTPVDLESAGDDTRRCILCWMYGDGHPADAGRLLYAGQDDWCHINCALWSAEVFEDSNGALQNVHTAIKRGKQLKCERCSKSGATVGCCTRGCPANYHFCCAKADKCVFQEDKKVFCKAHQSNSDGELVTRNKFEVHRRVCIDYDNVRWLKKSWLKGINPETVNILFGSCTVDYLGKLTPLSDQPNYLLPVDYCCTRIYWSTVDARKRCVYSCRIIEVKPDSPEASKVAVKDMRIVHDESHPDYVPLSQLDLCGINLFGIKNDLPEEVPIKMNNSDSFASPEVATVEDELSDTTLSTTSPVFLKSSSGSSSGECSKLMDSSMEGIEEEDKAEKVSPLVSPDCTRTMSLSSSWPRTTSPSKFSERTSVNGKDHLAKFNLEVLSPNTLKCLNISNPEKFQSSFLTKECDKKQDDFSDLTKVVNRLNSAAQRNARKSSEERSLPGSRPGSRCSSRHSSVERLRSPPPSMEQRPTSPFLHSLQRRMRSPSFERNISLPKIPQRIRAQSEDRILSSPSCSLAEQEMILCKSSVSSDDCKIVRVEESDCCIVNVKDDDCFISEPQVQSTSVTCENINADFPVEEEKVTETIVVLGEEFGEVTEEEAVMLAEAALGGNSVFTLGEDSVENKTDENVKENSSENKHARELPVPEIELVTNPCDGQAQKTVSSDELLPYVEASSTAKANRSVNSVCGNTQQSQFPAHDSEVNSSDLSSQSDCLERGSQLPQSYMPSVANEDGMDGCKEETMHLITPDDETFQNKLAASVSMNLVKNCNPERKRGAITADSEFDEFSDNKKSDESKQNVDENFSDESLKICELQGVDTNQVKLEHGSLVQCTVSMSQATCTIQDSELSKTNKSDHELLDACDEKQNSGEEKADSTSPKRLDYGSVMPVFSKQGELIGHKLSIMDLLSTQGIRKTTKFTKMFEKEKDTNKLQLDQSDIPSKNEPDDTSEANSVRCSQASDIPANETLNSESVDLPVTHDTDTSDVVPESEIDQEQFDHDTRKMLKDSSEEVEPQSALVTESAAADDRRTEQEKQEVLWQLGLERTPPKKHPPGMSTKKFDRPTGRNLFEAISASFVNQNDELPLHDKIVQRIKAESLAKSSPGVRGPFKCPTCKRLYRTKESFKTHVSNCDFEVSTSDEEEDVDKKEDSKEGKQLLRDKYPLRSGRNVIETDVCSIPLAKRKRGRPRKSTLRSPDKTSDSDSTSPTSKRMCLRSPSANHVSKQSLTGCQQNLRSPLGSTSSISLAASVDAVRRGRARSRRVSEGSHSYMSKMCERDAERSSRRKSWGRENTALKRGQGRPRKYSAEKYPGHVSAQKIKTLDGEKVTSSVLDISECSLVTTGKKCRGRPRRISGEVVTPKTPGDEFVSTRRRRSSHDLLVSKQIKTLRIDICRLPDKKNKSSPNKAENQKKIKKGRGRPPKCVNKLEDHNVFDKIEENKESDDLKKNNDSDICHDSPTHKTEVENECEVDQTDSIGQDELQCTEYESDVIDNKTESSVITLCEKTGALLDIDGNEFPPPIPDVIQEENITNTSEGEQSEENPSNHKPVEHNDSHTNTVVKSETEQKDDILNEPVEKSLRSSENPDLVPSPLKNQIMQSDTDSYTALSELECKEPVKDSAKVIVLGSNDCDEGPKIHVFDSDLGLKHPTPMSNCRVHYNKSEDQRIFQNCENVCIAPIKNETAHMNIISRTLPERKNVICQADTPDPKFSYYLATPKVPSEVTNSGKIGNTNLLESEVSVRDRKKQIKPHTRVCLKPKPSVSVSSHGSQTMFSSCHSQTSNPVKSCTPSQSVIRDYLRKKTEQKNRIKDLNSSTATARCVESMSSQTESAIYGDKSSLANQSSIAGESEQLRKMDSTHSYSPYNQSCSQYDAVTEQVLNGRSTENNLPVQGLISTPPVAGISVSPTAVSLVSNLGSLARSKDSSQSTSNQYSMLQQLMVLEEQRLQELSRQQRIQELSRHTSSVQVAAMPVSMQVNTQYSEKNVTIKVLDKSGKCIDTVNQTTRTSVHVDSRGLCKQQLPTIVSKPSTPHTEARQPTSVPFNQPPQVLGGPKCGLKVDYMGSLILPKSALSTQGLDGVLSSLTSEQRQLLSKLQPEQIPEVAKLLANSCVQVRTSSKTTPPLDPWTWDTHGSKTIGQLLPDKQKAFDLTNRLLQGSKTVSTNYGSPFISQDLQIKNQFANASQSYAASCNLTQKSTPIFPTVPPTSVHPNHPQNETRTPVLDQLMQCISQHSAQTGSNALTTPDNRLHMPEVMSNISSVDSKRNNNISMDVRKVIERVQTQQRASYHSLHKLQGGAIRKVHRPYILNKKRTSSQFSGQTVKQQFLTAQEKNGIIQGYLNQNTTRSAYTKLHEKINNVKALPVKSASKHKVSSTNKGSKMKKPLKRVTGKSRGESERKSKKVPSKPKIVGPHSGRMKSHPIIHPLKEATLPQPAVEEEIIETPLFEFLEYSEQRRKRLESEERRRGGPRLMFEITSDDGFHCKADSMEAAWKQVTEKVQDARATARMKHLNFSNVSGVKMFGLTHASIIYLLEQLSGANRCVNHRFRYHEYEKEEEEQEPAENPSGCIRAEPFRTRKPHDMFSFLMSKYRTLPEVKTSKSSDVMLTSSRRATSMELPMAMRFRHLQAHSKEAVGVYRSKIHGRGLYCKRDIDAGEMVIEYAGEVIRSALTDKREQYYESKSIGCYMFRIDDVDVVDATMHGSPARFINHSCDPNCYSKVINVDGKKHIVIFAMRTIVRGEELTYDYKFPIEDVKIPCTCTSKRCRKYLN